MDTRQRGSERTGASSASHAATGVRASSAHPPKPLRELTSHLREVHSGPRRCVPRRGRRRGRAWRSCGCRTPCSAARRCARTRSRWRTRWRSATPWRPLHWVRTAAGREVASPEFSAVAFWKKGSGRQSVSQAGWPPHYRSFPPFSCRLHGTTSRLRRGRTAESQVARLRFSAALRGLMATSAPMKRHAGNARGAAGASVICSEQCVPAHALAFALRPSDERLRLTARPARSARTDGQASCTFGAAGARRLEDPAVGVQVIQHVPKPL